MAERVPVYKWSLDDAIHADEMQDWRESYQENCRCARAIEDAISENYRDNRLYECAGSVVEQFGWLRTKWVMANTIRHLSHDGRVDSTHKELAGRVYIPNDTQTAHYMVGSHPGLVNLFADQVQQNWGDLHLYDGSHCVENDETQDYTDRIVVLNPDILKDEYLTPEDQLFLVTGGFGASPNSRGRKVYGQSLKDGEKSFFYRDEILGVLKDENIPDWASERADEIQAEKTEPNMTMEGV